jgi:hypothetical protein
VGHLICVVGFAFKGNQTGSLRIAHQAHRFPGNAETGLHFGAYWNIFDKLAQRIDQVFIELVTGIPAHFIAKQAAADTNPESLVRFHQIDVLVYLNREGLNP